MLHAKIIDLKKEKIEVNKAEEFISSSKFGASLIFKGTVRENNDNKKVTGITYDSHDAMVIKSFEEIYNEVDQKFKNHRFKIDGSNYLRLNGTYVRTRDDICGGAHTYYNEYGAKLYYGEMENYNTHVDIDDEWIQGEGDFFLYEY